MKILLIEDEKPLSDALCQIFSKKRWETFAAYNGETGLDEALTGIYDIILLDIMLPKLDGLTVLQRLREASISTPVTPLVLTVQRASTARRSGSSSNSICTLVSGSGWHRGISSLVRLAAMMPAMRATPSTSPFWAVPSRTAAKAAAFIVMMPRATACRAVTGFSLTSTITALPDASK